MIEKTNTYTSGVGGVKEVFRTLLEYTHFKLSTIVVFSDQVKVKKQSLQHTVTEQ